MTKKFAYGVFIVMLLCVGIPICSAEEKGKPAPSDSYNKVTDYDGIADNKHAGGTTIIYGYCPTCKYKMSDFDNVYSTYVATASDGRTVRYTICNSKVAATGLVACDITSDDFELPLTSDGHTNPNYQPYVDNWLNGTIVNGELDEKHPAAKALAQLYCDSTTITEQCRKTIKELVAVNKNDLIDSSIYQGAIIKDSSTGGQQAVNSYDDNLCSGQYPGLDEILCRDLSEACLAGTGTDYSKSNGKKIDAGTSGVCVWNSWSDLNYTDLTCKEQCQALCKEVSVGEGQTNCVKSCMIGRAGEDETCPENLNCKQSCEKLYPNNEAAVKACMQARAGEDASCPKDGGGTTPSCEENCEKAGGDRSTIESCKRACGGDENDQCTISSLYVPCSDGSCDYTPVQYQDSNTGGGCGTTQTISVYTSTTSEDYCNLAKIYTHTEVNISYPSQINQIIYAGQGFISNNKFSGTVTETTFISDIGAIDAAINKLQESKKAETSKMNFKVDVEYCSGQYSYNQCLKYDPETCTQPDKNSIKKKYEEEYKTIFAKIDAEIEQYKTCRTNATKYQGTHTTRTISTAFAQMAIGDYIQKPFSIKAVDKNSGLPLTSVTNNSIIQTKEYYVPSTVTNGSSGSLYAETSVTYGGENHQFTSTCPFNVANVILCPPSGCQSSMNLIYRPISLTNPFPSVKGTGVDNRKLTAFWNEATSNIFIKNNRDVSGYDVYNLTPMYTITLTPSTIKEIRNYNAGRGNYNGQKHEYSDFNLDCENGLYCKSKFLRETFNDIVDSEKSCGISDNWYNCDSEILANTRDRLLSYLR